jgi:hypothetical protein
MKLTQIGGDGEQIISRYTTPAKIVLAHLRKLHVWGTIICPEAGCSEVVRSINIGDEEVFVNDFEPIRREGDGVITSYVQRLGKKKDGRVMWTRHLTVLSLTDKSPDHSLLNSIEEYCYEREQAHAQTQAGGPADTEDTELTQSMSLLAVSQSEEGADSRSGGEDTMGGSE